MARAAETLTGKLGNGELEGQPLTPQLLHREITGGVPDPDLIVRTAGEQRLSDFLLWEAAYAELYFTDVYWPDFRREDLAVALSEFGRRERRFGGITAAAG